MNESGGAPRVPDGFRLTRVRVTAGSVMILLAGAAAALVLRNAFKAAHRQLGWAFACVFVALLLAPIVEFLRRFMPKWLAMLITMVSVGLFTATAWAGILVNIRDGFHTLEKQAPAAAASLERRSAAARQFKLVERVDSLIANFRQPSAGAAVGKAVGAAGTYFVCGILTLFFLIYGPKMLEGAFAQFSDRRRRFTAERRLLTALRNARRYILASMVQLVVVSSAVGLLSWSIGLPAPLVLGVLSGAIGLIPNLGIVVGGLPALLLATGLEPWRDAVFVLVVLLALQVVEGVVVRKRVDKASVHVGPALPAIVALIGYELYGIGGACYGAAGLVFLMAWLDVVGLDDTPALDLDEIDT